MKTGPVDIQPPVRLVIIDGNVPVAVKGRGPGDFRLLRIMMTERWGSSDELGILKQIGAKIS